MTTKATKSVDQQILEELRAIRKLLERIAELDERALNAVRMHQPNA